MSRPLYILNGPNLNLLGQREPEHYGSATLADIEAACREIAPGLVFRQTNIEGELIDHVHEAREKASALVINPGGYTHTSVALMDAVATLSIPVIEVHLSQTAAREEFRHISYVGRVATGTITGLGPLSYTLAVRAALDLGGGA